MRWAMCAVMVAACSGLPEVSDEGVHVRVAADPGLVMCGGTVDHMDAFIKLLAEEFEVLPPTGDERYVYYWLERDDLEGRTPCPHGLGGCSFGKQLWSTEIPHNHELVHNVAWSIGTPRPFFIEGLAMAYEGVKLDTVQWWDGEVERSLMGSHSRWVDYNLAGGFVRWLIDEHGIAAVLRLYAKVSFVATRGRVERVFFDSFGVTLADSVAAFERDKPCDDNGVTAMLVECAAPEISWDGVRHAEYRTLACEQEDVVGPYDGNLMMVFRTLVVPEAGEYEVTVIAEDLTGVAVVYGLYMTPCGSCRGRETELVWTARSVRMRLEAGVHSLRLFGPAREQASVGWSIERMP